MGSTDDPELSVGDFVRRFRLEAELTQEELAERAGLSTRGLSDLERGVIRFPHRNTLLLLADALQLSAADRQLLFGARRRLRAVPGIVAPVPPTAANPASLAPAPLAPAPLAPALPVPPMPLPAPLHVSSPPLSPPSQAKPEEDAQETASASGELASAAAGTLGSRTPAPAPLSRNARDPIQDQRRLVTILVAAISDEPAAEAADDAGEVDETLDPEDMRALMERYFSHASQVISAYGGTVEKVIGETVMAVFGLPRAHGDDAERALVAALALRETLVADALLGGHVRIQIGVTTGEVVVGREADHRDSPLTGEPVTAAARLQQLGEPGEILVGERVKVATETAFHFAPQRLLRARGSRRPFAAFPLTGLRAARQTKHPPLVGRTRDLAQLAFLYARVLEEQRAQAVSVVAPAGMGKSRLLEEFAGQLDPAERNRIARARCAPYERALTYRPLRRLLADLLGEDVRSSVVVGAFARAGFSVQEADGLARVILASLGLERDDGGPARADARIAVIQAAPAADRQRIFQAWHLLLEALVAGTPRVLVFEDLQWASEDLLDLVEYLMSPRLRAPVLFLAFNRPDLLDRRPQWGSGQLPSTQLTLEPLNPAQTRALVAGLYQEAGWETAPEQSIEAIVERSGGNPFFAIELVGGVGSHVRTLSSRGAALVGFAGSGHASGNSSRRGRGGEPALSLSLPDTVHDAVLARLDALPPLERTAVQVASVAGRLFHPPMLHAVLREVESATLDAALDHLLVQELVVPAEGRAYTFRHMLFREVAYRMLSRAARVQLHAAIAAWLEEFAGDRLDESVELIAYHYREATQLAREPAVPLEMPFDPARAIRILVRAGELASRTGAFVQAASDIRCAIVLAPKEEHLRLYELLGDYAVSGEPALEGYRTARELWRAQHGHVPIPQLSPADALSGARLARKLLALYLSASNTLSERLGSKELSALSAEAEILGKHAGDEHEIWRCRVAALQWVWMRLEDIAPEEAEAGRPVALAAADYFERRRDWAAFSQALDAYAGLSILTGSYEDVVYASNRRLASPRLSEYERADSLSNVCKAYYFMGEYEDSIAYAKKVLDPLEASGREERYGSDAVFWGAWAAYESGQWRELEYFARSLELLCELQEQGVIHGMVVALGYLPLLTVALACEDTATAERTFVALERASVDIRLNARSLVSALWRDDPAALRLEEDTPHASHIWFLTLLNEHGIAAPGWLIAERSVFKWEVLLRAAAIADALSHGDDERLAVAIDEAETHGLVPHPARMRIVLAERTGDRGQLERARPILERLGDRRGLRRLEAVAAQLERGPRSGGGDAEPVSPLGRLRQQDVG